MQLTKTKEKAILKIYDKWMHSYLNGDVATYDSYLDDDYHFIGSTDNEEFLTRKDTTNFFKATAEQFSGKTDLRNETTTLELFGELVFITHFFDAWFLNGSDWTYYARFRFSSIMQEKKGSWKFIYQHFSIADSKADEGETIGFDKVNLENQELREAIKRRTFELEEKNRELEVEGALERIRAQAVAMQQSSDLLDIVVTMRNEFIKLGHDAHYFWHMMWLPETYEKAMTSGDGTKIGFVMELPRHIHGDIPKLAKWEKSKKPTIVYAMTTKEAIDYVDKMVSLGDFQNIDPQAPSHDDLKHIGGLTFIMARTSHGEIGYSLPGVVNNPPVEDLEILERFAGAFDLAHRRFLDLQKAEKQRREVQIELALEKVRSRTMGMQRSDELRDTAMLLFQQAEDLDINSFACGFNIWDEDKKAATAWMASKDRLQPPFKTNSSEDVYSVFLEAEKRGDALFVLEQKGKELEEHYKYLVTIPEVKAFAKAGLIFPTYQIIHCAYFAQGYLMFITYEPVPNAHDIFKRFAKVFEQTYTRFLDLQKAEAQAREAQIETALEKVRSNMMAMHKSSELQEVIKTIFLQLQSLNFPVDASAVIIYHENYAAEHWFSGYTQETYPKSYTIPYIEKFKYNTDLVDAWKNNIVYQSFLMKGKSKIEYGQWLLKHTDFKDLPEEFTKHAVSPDPLVLNDAFNKYGMLEVLGPEELSKEQSNILKRFSKVFEQTYTRFLDLQKAEAQAKESEIELALERVRARTMAMQHSDELQEASFLLDEQVRGLGIKTWGCAFNIYGENESTEWFGNEKGVLPTYTVPRAGIFKAYYQKGQNGESLIIKEFSGKACVDHYEYMSSLPVIGDVLKNLKKTNNGYPTYQIDHVAYFKYGYLLFITKEHVAEAHDIFKRFAKVFQQTYTRFLDLQKAEAQAREAQIEASLERVRASAMAMHKSDDLATCVDIVFYELGQLGFNTVRCGIGIFNDQSNRVNVWTTSSNKNKDVSQLSGDELLEGHPLLEGIYAAWRAQVDYSYTLKGDDLKNYYKAVSDSNLPVSGPENNALENQYYHVVNFPAGGLFAFNDSELKLEEKLLMKRFGEVFHLSFTRHLDLKQAEAQAREAQIEAALERVRSQSMGMQTSEDLSKVTTEMFNQLREFNADLYATGIVFCDKHKGHIEQWHSVPNAGMMSPFIVPIDLDYIHQYRYDQWKKGTELFSIEIPSDFIEQHFNDIFKLPSAQKVLKDFEDQNTPMPSTPDWEIDYGASFKHGYLLVSSLQPFEEAEILPRFAKVFEQTYTRFLDLQKAEAQAREAQIEASLERVRARAMAMHQTDELTDVLCVLFDQFDILGINPVLTHLTLFDQENETFSLRITTTAKKRIVGEQFIDINAVEAWKNSFENWKKSEPNAINCIDYEPEVIPMVWELLNEVMEALPEGHKIHPKDFPNGLYTTQGHFKFGYIGFNHTRRATEEEKDIVVRFAKEFGRTYQRFLDLKKAEAQAREAQIEAALEKVRSRSLAVHKSDEFNDVVSIVFEKLKELQIPATAVGIGIKIEGSKDLNSFVCGENEAGLVITNYRLPYFNNKISKDICNAIEKQLDFYESHYSKKVKNSFYNYILEHTPEFKHLPEDIKTMIFESSSYTISMVASNHVVFNINNFEGKKLSEIDIDIIKRFTKVFNQAYIRFLDIEKAESQARESEIELALERVRARSMAMQNSSELKEVIQVVYDQFVQLNINIEHAGFILDYKENEDMHIWLADHNAVFPKITLPYFDCAHWNSFNEAKKKGQNFFVNQLGFEEKNKFYKDLFEFIPELPEETQTTYFSFDGLAISTVLLESIGLYIENYSGIPFSDEENNILMRFGKVFQQSYTRFLDLQKAEAQAREAQVEGALERVRSKTMAMHNSKDLEDIVISLFDEVLNLGIDKSIRCGIGILEDHEGMETRSANLNSDGRVDLKVGMLNMTIHPMLVGLKKAWEKGNKRYSYDYIGKDVRNYYEALNKEPEYPFNANLETLPEREFHQSFFYSSGILFAFSENPISEESSKILERFASVFGQTYRRFLDLQKAEAQFREAQIEAALERTRTQSMLMQHSDQLNVTAQVFHQQLQLLGIDSEFSYLWLPDEAEKNHKFWATWSETKKGKILFNNKTVSFPLDKKEPPIAACYLAWESGEIVHVNAVEPDKVEDYFNTWPELLNDVEKFKPKLFPEGLYYIDAYMEYGCFGIMTRRVLTQAEQHILSRFSKEFERTYSRFLGLQQAEAQAREAQIETALERVRSRTMAMQKGEELQNVVVLLYKELIALGLTNFVTCGYVEIDEAAKRQSTWVTSPGGDSLGLFYLPLTGDAVFDERYKAWKKQQTVFHQTVAGKERKKHLEYAITTFQSKEAEELVRKQFPDPTVFYCFNFSHGYLHLVGASKLTKDEEALLARFTRVFEQTYARFLDLKKAEAQAREAQIELALERVRSRSMAMQKSSELLEAAELLWTEITKLGIESITSGFVLMQEDEKIGWNYMPNPSTGKIVPEAIGIYHDKTDIMRSITKNWKKQKPLFVVEMNEEQTITHQTFIADQSINFHITAEQLIAVSPPELKLHNFNFKQGYLLIVGGEKLSQEQIDVMLRFTKVFQQTYTRFLDLQKAEAQAKEAKIEMALEKVRSRTMAMQHSDELPEAANVLFLEVQGLGIPAWSAGYNILSDDKKSAKCIMSSEGEIQAPFILPLTENSSLLPWYKAIKRKDAFFEYEQGGKDLIEHYKYMASLPELKQVFKQFKDAGISLPTFQVNHLAKFTNGFLLFITYERVSEAHDIFKRFAKVFEQTYTRFLDLQRAEEQAREAQIETALEKVRSRSMAMHTSEELLDVITVVSEQLQRLEFKFNHVSFTNNDMEQDYKFWVSAKGQPKPMRFSVPYLDIGVFNNLRKAQKKSISFCTDVLTKKEHNQWHKHLLKYGGSDVFSKADNEFIMSRGMARSIAINPNIILILANYASIPYSEVDNKIIERFGQVFEQSYTRFLDLQKAESQTRTAQINLAVERVRAKALAMHQSEEIMDVVAKLKDEVMSLDIPGVVAATIFLNEGDDKVRMWDLSTLEKGDNGYDIPFDISFKLKKTDPHLYVKRVWENTDDYFVEIQNEKDFKRIIAWLRENDKIKIANDVEDYTESTQLKQLYHAVKKLNNGKLVIDLLDPPSDEMETILTKMGAAFDLAYKRFEDLQKAEAQTREALIEAALEKVRSRSLAMHKPDELQEVVAVVAEKLQELDVILDAGGVIICTYFPDNKDVIHWISAPDFSHSGSYFVPYFDTPIFTDAWDSRNRGDAYFSKEFSVEAKNEFFKYAFKHSDYKDFSKDYKQHVLKAKKHTLSAAWSKNSAIIIPSLNGEIPTESDAEIIKRFAKVFEQAYIRFMDLQKAEAQARESQIEVALERVRSRTMAMQKSEELADTSVVVFKQLLELGISPNRLFIGIIKDNATALEAWATTEDGSKIEQHFKLYTSKNKSIKKMVAGWKQQKKSTIIDMKGKELQAYFHYLNTVMHIPFINGLKQKRRVQSVAYFSGGLIGMAASEEQPKETIELLERFAAVFNLTYTRFNDLKIAEANTEKAEQDLIKLQAAKKSAEDALSELQTTQTQLIQSEKMASLGELTAGIAHEIQNPLNFVNNFSEVSKELLEEMLEEIEAGDMEEVRAIMADVVQNLDKINHHGKRADGIVKGMLQHSRASGDKKEPTNINALADEYLRLAYHGLRAKDKSFNAQLVTDFDESIITVDVIPQDLGRVVLNLLTNAFYACTERSRSMVNEKKKLGIKDYDPTVTIGTKKTAKTIEIIVSDNGNGMPNAVKEKIFQPFFTTKPTGQGTGLGLSMSYDIITKGHGGELKVETKEGEGTTFTIELPNE